MSVLVVLAALSCLMLAAYRGYSVILFAPLIAMTAVLATDPSLIAPMFSGLFMEKMVGFLKMYFPIFLLGAIFGKLIEISGFSSSIVSSLSKLIGPKHAIITIVTVCAVLTYGGVSLFVVVFAAYPFASELFRVANIPKRLIPATIALGAFSFTMDALPGTPQIQNIIPTTFFKTTAYAAPVLGTLGSVFIASLGIAYLDWRRRVAGRRGEGYGTDLLNEPEPNAMSRLPPLAVALIPLIVMSASNRALTAIIPRLYGDRHQFESSVLGAPNPIVQEVPKFVAIWAVEGALLLGIASILLLARKAVVAKFAESTKTAISGAMLAAMNTASEYGFGAVIAALPGFLAISKVLDKIPYPLVNQAVTITSLAGITGSASGGLGIALAALASNFIERANESGIPLEVLHRVSSMASGGMDTLPHNGAVITLLAVTGLTHRQSYADIFAITLIKTLAVFIVIAIYHATGLI